MIYNAKIADLSLLLVLWKALGVMSHVDGGLREARLNHPKGFIVDERGIYMLQMQQTWQSGKSVTWGSQPLPEESGVELGILMVPAKGQSSLQILKLFILLVAGSCSLLVVDRGNQAIREIQLNTDDCAHQYDTGFPLDPQTAMKGTTMSPYQKPTRQSIRPPLIPTGDEVENTDEEGLFTAFGKLVSRVFKRRSNTAHFQQQQQRSSGWPTADSFVLPEDEIPPPLETRTPTTLASYSFTSKEPEKIQHIRHTSPYPAGWHAEPHQQQQQQAYQRQQLQRHRQYSSGPQTYYERSCETANEIIFGAVQELDSKRQMVEIKALNYGDPIYEQYGVRYRNSHAGFGNY